MIGPHLFFHELLLYVTAFIVSLMVYSAHTLILTVLLCTIIFTTSPLHVHNAFAKLLHDFFLHFSLNMRKDTIDLAIKTGLKQQPPSHRTSYKYEQGDWDSFRDFLRDAPWNDIFSLPADECALEVTSWIQAGIRSFVPQRRYQVKTHSAPWFSPSCAAAIAQRNYFFHLFRRDNSSRNKQLFTSSRNHCKKVFRDAQAKYMQDMKARIATQKLGSREFWKIYNNIFRKGKSIIPPLFCAPEVLSSSKDKAELFARTFSCNSTLNSAGHPIPTLSPRSSTTLSELNITPQFVSNVISCLKTSTAPGPDDIPAIVLKMCAPELSSILAKLFNKCLIEGCFPSCWKLASVVPAFKNSGERSDPGNYRPISLLPTISKVFESLLNAALTDHFESLGLLSDKQYGFRSSRSTADLLTVITERLLRALDKCGEARIVALDISKAFDKVWHAGLLQKLSSYGISGKIFSVIESFLLGRRLNVLLDGQKSNTYPVSSGVPQGSILGPILFLTYINDLPDNLICDICMYADDTSLYSCLDKKSSNVERKNLANRIERDLSLVSEWGQQWLVAFNSKKTKLLSVNRYRQAENIPVSMNNCKLAESSGIRLLGLTISNDLSWNEYVKDIAKKAAMKVGSMYRGRKFLTPESILHLYKSTIRPKMENCCHLWAGASASVLSLLDRIQKRVANIIGPELACKLQPLSLRRDVASLSLLYRYFHGRCSSELSSLVPPLKTFNRRTRLSTNSHPLTLSVPVSEKSFYSRSFFPRTATLWNSLSPSCFPSEYNLHSFKSRVNRFLSYCK